MARTRVVLLGALSLSSSSMLACGANHGDDLCSQYLPGAGSMTTVAAVGDRVYVSSSIELHVLNGNAGVCPAYRATYRLDAAGSGSMVAEEHLVFLSAVDGIHVVDTTLANAPRRLALHPAPLPCRESCWLARAGNRLYYVGREDSTVDGPTWLQVIDVSNPEAPVQIGATTTLRGAAGPSLVVGESLVVIGDSAVRVIDVKIGDAPVPLSEVPLVVQDPRPQLVASGTRLFIADGRVHEIDLALPGTPRHVATYDRLTHGSGWIPAGQVAVAGDRAWTTIGDFGIATFDAGTPGQLRPIGTWRPNPVRYIKTISWLDGFLHATSASPGGGPHAYLRRPAR